MTPRMPISPPSGPRKTKRHVPPTLKSPSQIASEKPRGPNQRLSSSHLVNASKTIARGASNTRTILTSRSEGVVTLSVPVLSMREQGWGLVDGPWKLSVCSSLGRRPYCAPGLRLRVLSLHLLEQKVEPAEVALPDLAIVIEPATCVGERLWLEAAWPALRVAAARDETSVLEYLEMLGDRGLAHREGLGQLHDACLARREPGENRAPRRVGEGGKGGIETIGGHHVCNLKVV